jgi:hypothetical protein
MNPAQRRLRQVVGIMNDDLADRYPLGDLYTLSGEYGLSRH